MRFALHAVCLAVLLCGLMPAALAQPLAEAVRVPVADESESARDQALGRAMDAMLVRLTGDPALPDTALAERFRDSAGRYLVSFSYRAADDDAGMRLAVRFERARLRDALSRAGVAVWPTPPPNVVVWLAVERDDRRFLVDADQGALMRERLREAAAPLGLSLLFPLMDLQDRGSLGYGDIAGGFADPVRAASARYAGEAALAGRLQIDRNGAVQTRWMLLTGDDSAVQRWVGEADAAAPALEAAVGTLTERLRSVYAYVPEASAGRQVMITVRGIDSLAAHTRLLARLETLAGVERVVPVEVAGDAVRLQLAVSVDEARVREALARDGRLRAQGDGYHWRP